MKYFSSNFWIAVSLLFVASLLPPQITKWVIFKIGKNEFSVLDILIQAGAMLSLFVLLLTWLKKGTINIGFALIALCTILTSFYCLAVTGQWQIIIYGLKFLGLFSLIFIRLKPVELKYLVKLLLYAIIFNYVFGLLTVFFPGVIKQVFRVTYSEDLEAFTLLGGQINLCYVAALLIVLLFYYKYKFRFVLSFVIAISSLLFDSRSGFALILIVLLYSYYIYIPIRSRVAKTLLIIVSLPLLLIATYNIVIHTQGRIQNLSFEDNSAILRFSAAQYCLHKIGERPITGYGAGVLFPYGDKYNLADYISDSKNPVMNREGWVIPTEPHNSFLLMVIEFGLIVFIIYVYLLIKKIIWSQTGKRDRNVSPLKMFCLTFLILGGLTSSFIFVDQRICVVFYCSILIVNNTVPIRRPSKEADLQIT